MVHSPLNRKKKVLLDHYTTELVITHLSDAYFRIMVHIGWSMEGLNHDKMECTAMDDQ